MEGKIHMSGFAVFVRNQEFQQRGIKERVPFSVFC